MVNENNSGTGLPKSDSEWAKEVESRGLGHVSLHGGKYIKPASKITIQQFLLLQVLWLGYHLAHQLDSSKWLSKASLTLAKSLLRTGMTGWDQYLTSIGDSTTRTSHPEQLLPLRGYSVVRDFQLALFNVVDGPVSAAQPKIEFSPIKTRAQRAALAAASAGASGAADRATDRAEDRAADTAQALRSIPLRPSTPRNQTNKDPFGLGDDDDDDDDAPLPAMISSIELSPYSPLTGEGARLFPAVVDEQLVNFALVVYLRALTLHYPRINGSWSPHRRAFVVSDASQKKIYEARVDGYLRSYSSQEISAIIEVKPCVRYSSDQVADLIKMQESAQMAAWICEEPPKDIEIHRKQNKPMTRLLVSQDRHEIYLTFAIFDAAYVDFIQAKSTELPFPGPFLSMQDYGPFCVNDRNQMQVLSEVLLAFTIQQCS